MNALTESLTYHDPTRRGFFSVLCDGKQDSFRLAQLPDVLDRLPIDSDCFISQNEFTRPNRRLVHLARLGLHFVDCETHKTHYGSLSPDAQAQALLLHCEENGLPRPSLINFSGRGLHAKWLLETPVPAMTLPRWSAVQKTLIDALKPFEADRGAKDGSRYLRVVGSRNSRSGQRVVNVYTDERAGQVNRWGFETICYEVLPILRNELQSRRKVAKQKAAGLGNAANLWTPKMLWWNRLDDLRRLIDLRGWTDGVPEGYRNNFLFVAACAVCWSAEPENLRAEVKALAEEYVPSLRPGEVRACTTTVMHKVKAGNPYRFTSERIIELLDIQPDEQRHLRTLITPDERIRRRRERDSRRMRGATDRQTYLDVTRAKSDRRRVDALALHQQGIPVPDIARSLGLSAFTIERLLRA